MNNLKKRCVLCIFMSLVLIATTISSSFANVTGVEGSSELLAENNSFNASEMREIVMNIERKDFDESKMSEVESEVLDNIVKYSINEIDGLENSEENRELVKKMLRDDIEFSLDESVNTSYNYSRVAGKKKPSVRISVRFAAAAFNAIANVIIISATGVGAAAGVRLLIKKFGQKGAQNYMKRTLASKIKTKLLKWGLTGTAAFVGSVIGNFLYNLLDPGTALANYLDRIDNWGKNGFIEA